MQTQVPGHQLHVLSQQVHQLPLPLVPPLGAQHHRHLRWWVMGRWWGGDGWWVFPVSQLVGWYFGGGFSHLVTWSIGRLVISVFLFDFLFILDYAWLVNWSVGRWWWVVSGQLFNWLVGRLVG